MADITITPANVSRVSGSIQRKDAGATITAGDSVYVDSAGVLQVCENDQTAVEAACAGLALNNGDTGQPVTYQVSGDLDPGGTLVAGEVYVVGAAPGAIAPVGDIAASEFATIIGIGTSTSNLKMGLLPSGVAAG